MIVSLRLAHCITYAALCITLGACNPTPPQVQTRVVSVPSSKPYRYIKPHPTEDKLSADTLAQISRHNTAHALVKKKEQEAEAQK